MEEIDVTARFGHTGEIKPLHFTWRQAEYLVTSVGRSWKDEAGHHILVMVPGDKVVELIFQADQERWYLHQPSSASLA
jgi:hypothetical protein